MALSVYNTLTRKKESFTPVTPGKVGIYLCGPTVYKPSHIGHAVGPIIFDAIKRYLVHRGFEVTWVVNITDVDDKLIVEAETHNTTTFELAERITKDYLAAMKTLGVDGIDIMPKASEHIGDIQRIIGQLIERGLAYESAGDVYFDVTKHADYGKLSNRRIDDQAGQRELQSGQKRNPGDFALWKAAKPDEPDEVKFDSPWGKGRPGWHIECSAMAMRYLGDTFDIHGGGLDLVFPHHENEIAQAEGATGKPFANVWMHNGLTRMNTKKISKSEADPEMQAALARMTLHNLLDRYPGELIRFFVLSTQYRRPIEYSEEEIESKRKGLDTFYRLFERIERVCGQSPYDRANDLTPAPHQAPATPGSATDSAAAADDAQGGWHGRAKRGHVTHGEPGRSGSARRSADDAATPAGDVASPATRAGIASKELAAVCDEQITAFERAMDDDFNTAGAIAALFEMGSAVNRFVEQQKLEREGDPAQTDHEPQREGEAPAEPQKDKPPSPREGSGEGKPAEGAPSLSPDKGGGRTLADPQADALSATALLIATARLIGLFMASPHSTTADRDGLTDSVMGVLIQIRQHVRKKKDFETADLIRDLLADHAITLEDRPEGTIWRAG